MTDKKIINFLAKIQVYCDKHACKNNCKFYDRRMCECKMRILGNRLIEADPEYWDIKEIERIIKQ